jgi:hypothetical protein
MDIISKPYSTLAHLSIGGENCVTDGPHTQKINDNTYINICDGKKICYDGFTIKVNGNIVTRNPYIKSIELIGNTLITRGKHLNLIDLDAKYNKIKTTVLDSFVSIFKGQIVKSIDNKIWIGDKCWEFKHQIKQVCCNSISVTTLDAKGKVRELKGDDFVSVFGTLERIQGIGCTNKVTFAIGKNTIWGWGVSKMFNLYNHDHAHVAHTTAMEITGASFGNDYVVLKNNQLATTWFVHNMPYITRIRDDIQFTEIKPGNTDPQTITLFWLHCLEKYRVPKPVILMMIKMVFVST